MFSLKGKEEKRMKILGTVQQVVRINNRRFLGMSLRTYDWRNRIINEKQFCLPTRYHSKAYKMLPFRDTFRQFEDFIFVERTVQHG